jgi:hypothetical protein
MGREICVLLPALVGSPGENKCPPSVARSNRLRRRGASSNCKCSPLRGEHYIYTTNEASISYPLSALWRRTNTANYANY